MPAYMREQMLDVMPKVVDRLMPHMIGDVVPLIIQPMIEYLQGKSQVFIFRERVRAAGYDAPMQMGKRTGERSFMTTG